MQMEDNTAEELKTKIDALVAKIGFFAENMEKEFNTRVRELFIEAVGAQVTAMENTVNAMSLVILQAKDAGFVECNRRVDETLARMSGTRLGKMSERTTHFQMPGDDTIKAAIQQQIDRRYASKTALIKARTAEIQATLHSHVPAFNNGISPASVVGMDETAGLVTTEGYAVIDTHATQEESEAFDALAASPTERALAELEHAVADDGYTLHHLKIWPEWFDDVASEVKQFEVRINDRDFKKGDYINLREFNPDNEMFTGRRLLREISYRVDLAPLGLPGHVALGIAKVKPVNG